MKKRNVIIPIVILVVLISIFVLFNIISRLGRYNIFVFNGKDYLLYQESNREWFSINKSEFIDKYKDKTYDLYVNNSLKGSFTFSIIDDKLEMVNTKNNVITRYTKDDYFLYGGNGDIEYSSCKNSDLSSEDDKVVYNKLKEYDLEKDYNPSYVKKYAVNADSDINIEYIYVISNMVNYDNTKINTNLDKVFSFMLLKDGNKVYDVYNSMDKSNMCVPIVEAVLNFRSDNSYKIATYCDDDIKLFNFKNGKFSNININN